MLYQVTILHIDGTQENQRSFCPDYTDLDNRLRNREIMSFVISEAQDL